MHFNILILTVLFCLMQVIYLGAEETSKQDRRTQEEKQNLKTMRAVAKFYEMPEGMDLYEITDAVLKSPYVVDAQKKSIQENQRKIFLFHYPSDGLTIKGVISFVPNPQEQPMLLLLRGGNRLFGLPNPGSELMAPNGYTVITTSYRGGVSEGSDEYGGQDVNDVKNLIDYIPELTSKLQIAVQHEKMFVIGISRGAMEMFLTLSRFPELQDRFSKAISLTGLLDLRQARASRPDLEKVWIEDFGFVKNQNEEEWINWRDPLLAVDRIDLNLPILIIQGTEDIRVDLEQGYEMVKQLTNHGNDVTYWEIPGGDHCLANIKDRTARILQWLEE